MLHVGGKSRLKQLKTLDWMGIVLFTAGQTIFLIGLNWGGNVYAWSSGHVLGALLGGVAGLVLFCFWEGYTTIDYPLIPMRLFRNIKYDATVACASVGAMVYYSMTVIWPSMIADLYTTDDQEIGWLSVSTIPHYHASCSFGDYERRLTVASAPSVVVSCLDKSLVVSVFASSRG